MEIIGVIVAGIIIGLLGKFVAPGDKDNIPIWLTILCGIGGVILGWFIYTAFGGNGSAGIDWVRWIVAIAVAAVLVVVASTVTSQEHVQSSESTVDLAARFRLSAAVTTGRLHGPETCDRHGSGEPPAARPAAPCLRGLLS